MNRTVENAIRYRNITEYVISEPGTQDTKRLTVTDQGTVHPSHVWTNVRPSDLEAINERRRQNHRDAVEFCERNGIDPSEELDDPDFLTTEDIGTLDELDEIRE